MKKMGILLLVAVLALGALGVGYAAWQSTLTISGTVNTATYNPAFTALSSDPLNNPDVTNGADIASTIIGGNVDQAGNVIFTEGVAGISIAIDNAYPGYTSTVTVTLTNNGNIPIKASFEDWVFDSGDALLADAIDSASNTVITYNSAEYESLQSIAAGGVVTAVITIVIPDIPPTTTVDSFSFHIPVVVSQYQ